MRGKHLPRKNGLLTSYSSNVCINLQFSQMYARVSEAHISLPSRNLLTFEGMDNSKLIKAHRLSTR